MKNITVSVEDEIYYRARIKAAEQHTSVSAIVRDILKTMASAETDFERLAREEMELVERIRRQNGVFSARNRLSREAVHDRNALR